MKQTTLTQRLLSALVALCMVLSVCAPALAAEPEIGNAAMITLTKGGTTTDLKMPEGNVSLRAEYRETYQIFETAGKAEFFAEGAEEQRIYEALPGTRIIAKVPDSELNDYRQFNMWRLVSEKELVEPDQNWQGKQSFRFTMPEGDVELQAFFTTLYDVNVTHGHTRHHCGRNRRHRHIPKDREAGPAGHRPGRKHGGEPLPAVDVYRQSTRSAG